MSKPVNLYLIAEHFYPNLSGASERFLRYLPGLRERGVNVEVLTIWQAGLIHKELINDTPVHRLDLPSSVLHPSAELAKQTLHYLKQTNRWPDVVHVLSHTIQGVPYLWKMRFHGVPCLNSITMYPNIEQLNILSNFKVNLHQWFRYSVFNTIISSSEKITEKMNDFGIPKKRIHTIPNGVDLTQFSPLGDKKRNHLKKILGYSESDKIVLFVGFISRRKGVDLLLEAWRQVREMNPKAKLVLIGPESRQGLENGLFEKLNKPHDGVQILGKLENVNEYMQIADIFILPSRLEGMPNVVLEAMASGLPCILTPFSGLPQSFGRPGENYVLTSFEPSQIAEDILSLLSDQDRQDAISKASLERIAKNFNLETVLDQYAEIYHYWASQGSKKRQ